MKSFLKLVIVINIFFVSCYCFSFNYGKDEYTISFSTLGVENTKLVYDQDFEVILSGNGEKIRRDKYKIVAEENLITIKIKNDFDYKVFRIEIKANGYKVYSINLPTINFIKQKKNLASINLEPLDFMIYDISIFTNKNANSELNFELTFRNNSTQEVLINLLSVDMSGMVRCAFHNPFFANVTINKNVIVENQLYNNRSNSFKGTYSTNSGNVYLFSGNIVYNACGFRSMHLTLPISIIVPSSKYSKMKFSIPNNINVYRHFQYKKINNSISLLENSKSNDSNSYKIKTIESIFNLFNNIKFRVFTDQSKNDIVTKVYKM